MCIVSDIIERISSTNILIAANLTNMEQLTVYSNTTHNQITDNYMILPIPMYGSDNIRFINLDKVEDPFIQLAKLFERKIPPEYTTYSKGRSVEVKHYDVGCYDVYMCKTLGLVSNFGVGKEVVNMLHNTYGNKFSYLLCKLKTGNSDYKHHPIAYILKLENNNLFVPTKHLHRHTADEVFESKEIEKWDHSIYVYNLLRDDVGFCKFDEHSLGLKKFNFVPHITTIPIDKNNLQNVPKLDFKGDPIKTITKLSITRMFYNDDLVVRVAE